MNRQKKKYFKIILTFGILLCSQFIVIKTYANSIKNIDLSTTPIQKTDKLDDFNKLEYEKVENQKGHISYREDIRELPSTGESETISPVLIGSAFLALVSTIFAKIIKRGKGHN